MQKRQRFVADQRVDLPHIERMLSYIEQEFSAYNRAFSPSNIIFKNWRIEDNGGLSVRIDDAEDSLLFDTEKPNKEGIIFRRAGDPIISLTLANNSVNYVELHIESVTEGPQIVALWDDNAKQEYAQVVNTCFHEKPKLVSNVIGFTSDPDKLKLAIVTTVGGVITSIVDSRNAAFHLVTPWNFGIVRTDFGIESVKDSFDALATSFQELKGSVNWYDLPTATLKLLKEYQNTFYVGGGNVEWEGINGANSFGWTDTIRIEIAGRPQPYTLVPGAVTLLEGQCMYVDIPEGVPLAPLAPLVSNLTTLALVSATGKTLQVLFFRRNNLVTGVLPVLRSVQTRAANYQILAKDSIVRVTTTCTQTMPDATLVKGEEYTIKKLDSNATTVTIAFLLGQTADGDATLTLEEQYTFYRLKSNGINYDIIGAG